MRRIAVLFLVMAAALAALYLTRAPRSEIVVTNAKAYETASRPGMFMVTLDVQNNGPATTLTGAAAPQAQMFMLMNPGYEDAPIAIPEGGRGIFAMDGAHFMLRADPSEFTEGALMPISLEFAGRGTVATRVGHAGATRMDHANLQGITSDPVPVLGNLSGPGLSGLGGEVTVPTRDIVFVASDAPRDHVHGEGHAHVYLNGLKLQRLYGRSFELGALPTGRFELKVSLNANDHRPYLDGQEPVETKSVMDIANR